MKMKERQREREEGRGREREGGSRCQERCLHDVRWCMCCTLVYSPKAICKMINIWCKFVKIGGTKFYQLIHDNLCFAWQLRLLRQNSNHGDALPSRFGYLGNKPEIVRISVQWLPVLAVFMYKCVSFDVVLLANLFLFHLFMSWILPSTVYLLSLSLYQYDPHSHNLAGIHSFSVHVWFGGSYC